MAVTKTIKLRNGLTAENAYIRVDAFNGSKGAITYSANTYLSEQAFKGSDTEAPAPYLEQELFEFEPDSAPDAPHVWAQCYNHLLQQDRFAGATNC
jgi:hypothetical protein